MTRELSAPRARTRGHRSWYGPRPLREKSSRARPGRAIAFGPGFPDTDGPPEALEAAVTAIRAGRNQYPAGAGVPELLRAVAAHQERFCGLTPDPAGEVLVTWIETKYNRRRRQRALGKLTPVEFEGSSYLRWGLASPHLK